MLRTPAIGDIDGDLEPEIVDSAGEHVYAWNADGTVVPGFPVRLDPALSLPQDRTRNNHIKRGFSASPALGDLDDDGRARDRRAGARPARVRVGRRRRRAAGLPEEAARPGIPTAPRSSRRRRSATSPATASPTSSRRRRSSTTTRPRPRRPAAAPRAASRNILTNILANVLGGSGRVYALDRNGERAARAGRPRRTASCRTRCRSSGPGVDHVLANVDGDPELEAIGNLATGDVTATNGDGSNAVTYDSEPAGGEHVDKSKVLNLFENPIAANIDGVAGPGDHQGRRHAQPAREHRRRRRPEPALQPRRAGLERADRRVAADASRRRSRTSSCCPARRSPTSPTRRATRSSSAPASTTCATSTSTGRRGHRLAEVHGRLDLRDARDRRRRRRRRPRRHDAHARGLRASCGTPTGPPAAPTTSGGPHATTSGTRAPTAPTPGRPARRRNLHFNLIGPHVVDARVDRARRRLAVRPGQQVPDHRARPADRAPDRRHGRRRLRPRPRPRARRRAKLVTQHQQPVPATSPSSTRTTPATGATWRAPRCRIRGPRPRLRSPTSLVPAYQECTAPNRVHGPPLGDPSCAPPVRESSTLTVGTPDANGSVANSDRARAAARDRRQPGHDRRRGGRRHLRSTSPTCAARRRARPAHRAQGPTTPGRLLATAMLRITDKFNGAVARTRTARWSTRSSRSRSPASPRPASASARSCAVSTTMDALLPGAVVEGKRAVWQTGRDRGRGRRAERHRLRRRLPVGLR